jgi:hypothetical protein
MRYYARNTDNPRFKTKVDENNWFACHRAIARYSDRDRDILIGVYGWYDTLADNVYVAANTHGIDQNVIWDMMKEFERSVAKKRGLL